MPHNTGADIHHPQPPQYRIEIKESTLKLTLCSFTCYIPHKKVKPLPDRGYELTFNLGD